MIQALPIKELKSAELTAMWEQRLNKIAEGKDSLPLFVLSFCIAKKSSAFENILLSFAK